MSRRTSVRFESDLYAEPLEADARLARLPSLSPARQVAPRLIVKVVGEPHRTRFRECRLLAQSGRTKRAN
jgi:hypothetical protein